MGHGGLLCAAVLFFRGATFSFASFSDSLLLLLLSCVHTMYLLGTHATEVTQRSDGNFVGSVLSFHLYLSSWAQTQVSTASTFT